MKIFKKRLHSVILSIILFLLVYGIAYTNTQENNKLELETILKKSAEYCERLANSVLYFVCKEEITEKIYRRFSALSTRDDLKEFYPLATGGTVKNVYVYDYQLIRKKNEFKEQRILIEENGKKKHEESAPLKTIFFKHENIVFGPIGLLSSYWQPRYDYRILKEKKFKGDKAVIIEATPKSGYTFDHPYGKIWVRKTDLSILKIEWYQQSIKGYEYVEETARRLRAKPHISLVAEYGFEKNEIRFPSKYSLDEVYIITRGGNRYRKSETVILYRNYKFFTVEWEVKH